MRPHALVLLLAAALSAALPVSAVTPAPTWPNVPRVTPEELAKTLREKGGEKPAVFMVGFRVLFTQAHIPGAQFAGPGVNADGIAALLAAAKPLAKGKPIVLYCGCCPWEKCPNMAPAWKALQEAGFTNVKVVVIPKNFGADWVQKGYPVESETAAR